MAAPTVSAASTGVWAAVGGAAGAVALATALINHRTARLGLRKATAPNGVPEAAPKLQLPVRPHLVNREDAMGRALELIRSGESVVAIEGESGVGKSTLAKELAHRLSVPAGPGEPDLSQHTFLWLDAGNGCPRLVDICSALSLLTGDQSLSAVAESRKLDALRAHLARNKTVLVLDNLDLDETPESALLRELIQTVPAGTLVIASIDRRAGIEAALVALEDLHSSHVRELILYETKRLGLVEASAFDDALAWRLHRAVGGNPARIEAFLRALPGSAHSVEERLEAVERGEGLAEFFAPAWQNLTEDARNVLAACALLRGNAILDQLAVACRLEGHRVGSLLEELIEVGLVIPVRVTGRPNVFACPHGVQRYVRFETPQEAVAAFTERLTHHYIEYFSHNPEDARGAVPHVAALQPLLEELFARASDDDLQKLFVALLDILFSLGLFDERIATGTLAYESAARAGNHSSASLASEVLSSTHAVRGEFQQAREALALGLVAAEHSGSGREVARQKRCTAFIHYRAGEPEHALAALEGADELARATRAMKTLVNILNLRSYAHWHLGALDESEAAARESLEACEAIAWERAKAFPIRQLAEIAIHRGELARGRELLERAKSIAVQAEDKRHLARVRLAEARLALALGDPGAARAAAVLAEYEATTLGLPPEAREAAALKRAAGRARLLPIRIYYARRRPTRLTDAPV